MATHTLPPPGNSRGGTATGCPTSRPSRRDLLGAAGFTALAGIAAVAIATPDAAAVEHGADAALIALCNRFADLERQKLASYGRDPRGISYEQEKAIDDRERQPIWAEQEDLVASIIDARATTLDGFRARARALVVYDQQGWKDEEISSGPWPGGMCFALVRDLVGGSV